MSFGSSKQTQPTMEMIDYHLIFNLNGVLVVISESQIRSCLIVLNFGLKEFFSTCVKKFTMYVWSSAMKRNFSKHLDIIAEKTKVLLPTSKILD
jgi:hypothetical protein